MRFDCQILLKLPLLTLLAGSAPEPSLCRFVSNVAHNCSRCYRNLLRLIYCDLLRNLLRLIRLMCGHCCDLLFC